MVARRRAMFFVLRVGCRDGIGVLYRMIPVCGR